MSEANVAKQIACIAAYAAGVAVGIYATCKVVNAIEKKWPMKSNPLDAKIHTGIKRQANIKLEYMENMSKARLTVKYEDGLKETVTFEGTPAAMSAKCKELNISSAPIEPLTNPVPAAA